MWRHIVSNGFSLLIVLLVILVALIGWGTRSFNSEGPLAAPIFFEVERGASLQEVSDDLLKAGAISNATLFRIGADYTDRAAKLKFGNYSLPAGASMDQILAILTEGGASSFRYVASYVIRNDGTGEMRLSERDAGSGEAEVITRFTGGEPLPELYAGLLAQRTPIALRVVVPEGLTSWQITEALKGAEFLEGEIPEVPAEGTLAPETYEVSRGATRARLLERMAERQSVILAEAWENRNPDVPVGSPEEALILASIVEKETALAEERGQVASVFVNRMREGMRLQTDPTVIYGITQGKGILDRGLRQSELRERTEWNTYVIEGLPPTPIANPGRASIEAALNPAETDFLYFVADGSGGHAFARTLAEHNANVRKWREIERGQANQ